VSTQAPSDETPKPPEKAAGTGIGIVGISVIVFILGVVVGVPIANFGADVLVEYAGQVFAILFGIFLIVLFAAALIALFRRQIWSAILKRAEIELERFAGPLADVAKFAAEQRVAEATTAARDLAELVLARYAWVSTRRWLIAAITALIAAIAALAGSALLFQQNNLLRSQMVLMAQQNDRVGEQNNLLRSQVALVEAQRAVAIVPEILDIGATLARELDALDLPAGTRPTLAQLSPTLRARFVAATLAARPYRYMRPAWWGAGDQVMSAVALSRRPELKRAQEASAGILAKAAERGLSTDGLTDRPVSPERGQLLGMLGAINVPNIQLLSSAGVDFTFAEIRQEKLAGMSLALTNLRFADFSTVELASMSFTGAFLENARFRDAIIQRSSFSGIAGAPTWTPYASSPAMAWRTQLTGADFSGAVVVETGFTDLNGIALDFDGATLNNLDFARAEIAGATFRDAVIGKVNFTGASLKSVDFDGAVVFEPDFLTRVAAKAAPDSFIADRFEIVPITPDELAALPQWALLDYIGTLWQQPAFRIKRIKDFE